MKLGLLGGTFNPVHCGHLAIARSVLEQTECSRVVFVPSNVPAHKALDSSTPAQDRLEMLYRATRTEARYLVDDCEIRRGGVSYTIDTVRYLIDVHKLELKPVLVIGDDLLDGFEKWKSVTELVELTDLVVAHRRFEEEVPFRYPHRYLDNRIWRVSSSEIRERRAEGKAIDGLVPDEVALYIESCGLYLGR